MNQIRRAQNFTSCLFVILKCWVMDKLQLTGPNLGRVFNFSCGHLHAAACFVSSVKLPNLELKTRPKQLLGSLPLVIVLPGWVVESTCYFTGATTFSIVAFT
jgi:hypothetical protein